MSHYSQFLRNRWLTFASLLILVSCGSVNVADLDEDDFDGTGANPCDGVTTSFNTDVVPIFAAEGCTNGTCHSDGSQAGSLNLDINQADGASGIHAEILDGRIDDADTANSLILRKPLGLDSHTGGAIFTSVSDPNYVSIFCWIEAGATDDST